MVWNDILTIVLAIITILNFIFGRGDKNKASEYQRGVLDQQLRDIKEDLQDIKNTLSNIDKEREEEIRKAIENHVKEYHKRG